MRKIFVFGLIVFLLGSCLSLNQFVVTPLGEEPAEYSQRFVYSLPQTVVEVKMDFVKTSYLPGPYRRFTEKYLGMTNYISEEQTRWQISGIELSEFQEPDPLHYYSVNLIRGSFQSDAYFSLSSNGLIIDPMGAISSNVELPANISSVPRGIVEIAMKKNMAEKTDTLFKTVITDSSFVKIPILRKQKDAKTLEQKAEEAANLIIKIRKRRLKLVTGEYNVFPEGIALEVALAELDRTEKEYTALFTGKIFTETFSRSFIVAPAGSTEKLPLLRFSEDSGMLSIDDAKGQTVSIEIDPLEGFPISISGKGQPQDNTLYYRIPSTCSVKLTLPDQLLYEGRMSVYQSGSVLPLPVKGR